MCRGLINEVREKILIEFANVDMLNIDKIVALSKTYFKMYFKNVKFRADKLNGFEIFNLPDKKNEKILFVKNILQELL